MQWVRSIAARSLVSFLTPKLNGLGEYLESQSELDPKQKAASYKGKRKKERQANEAGLNTANLGSNV